MSEEGSKPPGANEWRSNGLLYPVAAGLMWLAQKVSAVELLKKFVCRLAKAETKEQRRAISGVVIDAFIILKFAIVIAAWCFGWNNVLLVILVGYLLVMNSLTYFYHHLWFVEGTGEDTHRVVSHHRDRRRFVSLVLAMAFSMIVYAYLYRCVLANHVEWPVGISRSTAALSFSIGNALTSTAGGLRPTDEWSYLLASSQLVFTFGFVAMLLSNSIPRVKA